jgi:hypothetical protein
VDRQDVQQRIGAQDHAGGVDAGAAGEAFQAAGGVDDPADVVVGLV